MRWLIVFAVIFIVGCSLFLNADDRCVNKIYKTAIKSIKKEPDLRVCGTGGGGDGAGKFDHLNLSFDLYRPIVEEEARVLVLKLARALRDAINSHSCGQELFSVFPVTPDQVSIDLYISDRSGQLPLLPSLSFVIFHYGKIHYHGTSTGDYKYDYEYTETLQEALEKLGESQF